MIVWRVTRKAHAEQPGNLANKPLGGNAANQPLSGEGAKRYGGRWNHIGVAVVYTSQSLSLATLEYLVNLSIIDLPDDLVAVEIELPDDLPRAEITIKQLPANWRTFPSIEELKDIGTDWARQATVPVLVVPSVVIPNELNYLVNPLHPLSQRLKVVSVAAFTLDTRLYSKRKPARKPSRKVTQ